MVIANLSSAVDTGLYWEIELRLLIPDRSGETWVTSAESPAGKEMVACVKWLCPSHRSQRSTSRLIPQQMAQGMGGSLAWVLLVWSFVLLIGLGGKSV